MKKLVRNVSVGLALSLCLASVIPAQAIESNTLGDEIFPRERVEMLQSQYADMPIYLDKDVAPSSLAPASLNGSYPTRKGVILQTDDAYKGLIPTGHAAIVYSSSKVVESISSGVVLGNNNWSSTKKTCYGLSVIGTSMENDAAAANWSYRQIGKPYNYNYLNRDRRDKFYCSQLVWAAYKDNFGIDLDTSEFGNAVHPVELRKSSRTYTIYQK